MDAIQPALVEAQRVLLGAGNDVRSVLLRMHRQNRSQKPTLFLDCLVLPSPPQPGALKVFASVLERCGYRQREGEAFQDQLSLSPPHNL